MYSETISILVIGKSKRIIGREMLRMGGKGHGFQIGHHLPASDGILTGLLFRGSRKDFDNGGLSTFLPIQFSTGNDNGQGQQGNQERLP